MEDRFRQVLVGISLSLVALSASCGKTVPPEPDLGDFRPIKTQPNPEPSVVPLSTTIKVGEKLDLFVNEDESFKGNYMVREDGEIILPKIGRVSIGGKSIEDAQTAVKTALELTQLKTATVIIARSTLTALSDPPGGGGETPPVPSVEVFIQGKVAQPGRYRITSVGDAPPSVYQSILQAGGFARFASPKKVHILRRDASGKFSKIDSNIEAISKGEQRDIAIVSGDIIVVPEKYLGGGGT